MRLGLGARHRVAQKGVAAAAREVFRAARLGQVAAEPFEDARLGRRAVGVRGPGGEVERVGRRGRVTGGCCSGGGAAAISGLGAAAGRHRRHRCSCACRSGRGVARGPRGERVRQLLGHAAVSVVQL